MNFKLLIIVFFLSFSVLAQERKQTDTITIEINSKTKTIYVLGGIASVITKEDLAFAKEYNLKFYDFGCLAPVNFEFYEAKNNLVFEFLNENYGEIWQKDLKPNVMGFEKWKRKLIE